MSEKAEVKKALAELYLGRSKHDGYRYVRSILTTHGNGARTIHELKSEFYGAVYATAGGRSTATPAVDTEWPEPWDVENEPTGSPPLPPRTRPLTPLIKDLETRLAAVKAKTKRSIPSGPVNLGNASRLEDQADDVPLPQIPGEKVA